MFHVKICGITSVDDAQAAIAAGADAIGLNFYRKSPRAVTVEKARQIGRLMPASVARIGVFVNADPAEVCETFDQAGLDAVQLHGDEPPEYARQLGGRPVLRAFRLDDEGLDAVEAYLSRSTELDALPRMILVDAFAAGAYGGTGETLDWRRLADDYHLRSLPPLVLAGGLNAGNVAEAIRVVRPSAVDVASGVESRPGRKDPGKVKAFVAAARAALRNSG